MDLSHLIFFMIIIVLCYQVRSEFVYLFINLQSISTCYCGTKIFLSLLTDSWGRTLLVKDTCVTSQASHVFPFCSSELSPSHSLNLTFPYATSLTSNENEKLLHLRAHVMTLGLLRWSSFSGGSAVKNLPATKESQETQVRSWLGRSPGGGHGNPLQYSCLKNPKNKGACQPTYSP